MNDVNAIKKIGILRELISELNYATEVLQKEMKRPDTTRIKDRELTVVWSIDLEIKKLSEDVFGNSDYEQNIKNTFDENLYKKYNDSKMLMETIKKNLGLAFEQCILAEVSDGIDRYERYLNSIFSQYELDNIKELHTGYDLDLLYTWRDRIETGLSLIGDLNTKTNLEQAVNKLDFELKKNASDSKWTPIFLAHSKNLKAIWHPNEWWWWHLDKLGEKA